MTNGAREEEELEPLEVEEEKGVVLYPLLLQSHILCTNTWQSESSNQLLVEERHITYCEN